jgi:hypothetical protein
MPVDRLQTFLDLAASAPPERDARHFQTWQRVSVRVQRELRSLAAQNFFAEESRAAADLDRAFTMVVYSCCQPCYGQRPMEFTYDIGELVALSTVLRLIGRSMQARLAQISAGMQSDPRLKRRFLPVWHADILKVVRNKPRTFIEMLAREGNMINGLIDLGTTRSERTAKRFLNSTEAAARILGIPSSVLQDLVLRTGAENLVNRGIIEDGDEISAGSPDAGIGGDEDRDDGSPDGGGQMADAGIVPDIQLCG